MSDNCLLIVTGPSCAGKSPLVSVLLDSHPDWASGVKNLVLYNSRERRPIEVDGRDYHFRERSELESMQDNPDCICMDVRGDFQVLDVAGLKTDLASSSILFEGNPFFAKVLQTDPRLSGIPRRSIFISPLSREEINQLIEIDPSSVGLFVEDLMREKLIRRTLRQKGEVTDKDIETITRRSQSAWSEIQMAPLFDYVVTNHDGEDSDNWFLPILIGDARLAAEAVFAGLTNTQSDRLEKWDGIPH